MKKLSVVGVSFLALLATLAADVRLPQAARAMSLVVFEQPGLAASQIPAGFVLPSSDVDLRISSLVAADLDADGDLDIVAAAAPNGSPDIVVWVNDGRGRLTRKRPEPAKALGAEPPAPTVDQQHSTVAALTQTDSPAIHALTTNVPFKPAVELCRLPRAPSAVSEAVATLRSRAPPVLS